MNERTTDLDPIDAADGPGDRAGDSRPLYARHFGLARTPFSIAPDPRYLYMSKRHREALAHLLYGLQGGGGFVLLTGEVGAGKTTVCRCMLEQVPPHCAAAYVFNPRLTVEELLETICDEFRIPRADAGATLKAHVDALNRYLLESHAAGRNNVLVIDEAQNLSPAVLEQLRLLTNLETNERKLLQIVLVGQPELRAMLAAPGMEQLAQRVVARYHLDALSSSEVARYIRHRLRVAGLRGSAPFDADALRRVARHSRGVARRINLLCDRALLGAYAEGRSSVSTRIVDKAAREAFDEPAPAARWPRGLLLALGAAIVALGVGVAGPFWRTPTADSRSIRSATPSVAPRLPRPVAAAPAAVAPAPTEAAIPLKADALATMFGARGDEAEAWRQLGAHWGLTLDKASPCRDAAGQSVHCYRDPGSNLNLIRQLGRPGILTLHGSDGREVRVLLVALDAQAATLRGLDGSQHRVTLDSLAPAWRGEFATLWRVPPGYRAGARDVEAGPTADAVRAQFARVAQQPPVGGPIADDLPATVAAFQLAHGLKPDGKAGPLTLMHLNPLSGVDEPRLTAEPLDHVLHP